MAEVIGESVDIIAIGKISAFAFGNTDPYVIMYGAGSVDADGREGDPSETELVGIGFIFVGGISYVNGTIAPMPGEGYMFANPAYQENAYAYIFGEGHLEVDVEFYNIPAGPEDCYDLYINRLTEDYECIVSKCVV